MTDETIQVTINQSHWIVVSANYEGISVNELISERQHFLTTQIQAGMKISQNSRGRGPRGVSYLRSLLKTKKSSRTIFYVRSYLTRRLSEPCTTLNNTFIPVYLTFLG